METHPHPNPAHDEEFLAPRRHAQLLAQCQQLDQGVRAIEHPDLGAGNRLQDFAPPFVDQVGRRKYQGATIAFGVENGGRGDADRRLADAHLAIDDCSALAAIGQQLGDGMNHFRLRREKLALEAGQDHLAVGSSLAGVDRRIGAVERVQKLVAKLRDKILEAQLRG